MSHVDEDYTEEDRWDWDRNDSSQYCRHGSLIGSWWGPDLLCGACESGISDRAYERVGLQNAVHHAQQYVNRWWFFKTEGERADANILAHGLFGYFCDVMFTVANKHEREITEAFGYLEAAQARLAEHVAREGEIPEAEYGY